MVVLYVPIYFGRVIMQDRYQQHPQTNVNQHLSSFMDLAQLQIVQNKTVEDIYLEDENNNGVVSFHAHIPTSIQLAMKEFIERHPNWDQYRLIQAALAGFLVQNGVETRSIARLYVGNMFSLNSFNKKAC